jgi:hypothetical protein
MYVGYEDGDGAVVMTNSDNGFKVIAEIIPTLGRIYHCPAFMPKVRTLASVPLAQKMKFAGTFAAKDVYNFQIAGADNGLQLSIPSRPSTPLLPSSPMMFFVTDNTLQISFDTPDRGLLIFGEQKIPFVRVQDGKEKPQL